MIQRKAVSLADQIYDQLENDILSGKLEKGQVLTENSIAQELGVSRTPVREALSQLVSEHMVEERSKCLIVVGITDKDMETIYDIREKIEGLAAGMAAEIISEEQLSEMQDILDLQEFYISKNDSEKIREQDNAFHDLLYRASGNVIMYDTLASLHKKVQKYRRLSVSSVDRAQDSFNEHKTIYEALKAHDKEAAQKLTEQHVKNARVSIIRKLEVEG